ncbi:MAG: hypothetical protein QOG03_1003 [Actinomycetota bacterium]|jgi:AcrR family transcriptional regulator|nr:hypothetical protein [Actinomycetota bacterium]
MVKTAAAAATSSDWREARRQSARALILESAWEAVRDEGLAALSLRDLARRAGITTPTVYAYFDSKNDIYDAMFGQAAEAFAQTMGAPYTIDDPRDVLVDSVNRFATFCTSDLARYQLLFQRTIPGFEPSPESYAPAVRALAGSHERLARNGITSDAHRDMFTAVNTGLVNQQTSNDPGGDRWIRLIEDVIDMYLAFCQGQVKAGARPKTAATKTTQTKTTPTKSKGTRR